MRWQARQRKNLVTTTTLAHGSRLTLVAQCCCPDELRRLLWHFKLLVAATKEWDPSTVFSRWSITHCYRNMNNDKMIQWQNSTDTWLITDQCLCCVLEVLWNTRRSTHTGFTAYSNTSTPAFAVQYSSCVRMCKIVPWVNCRIRIICAVQKATASATMVIYRKSKYHSLELVYCTQSYINRLHVPHFWEGVPIRSQ
jgi:hypothetical protein